MSRASLDWHDDEAVARWLGALRVSLNDAHAVTRDMLRAPRERELGPALHARNYDAAWQQVVEAIEYATKPDPEGGVH
jgi:predicted amidohydrolase YtcJ